MSKLLQRVTIPTPCSAKWEEMTGNDQVRFCAHCDLSVQDLSQMTRAKAVKLVRQSNGRLCLRFRRTPEGEIITRPVYQTLHAISRRTSRLAAGAFTAVMGLSAAAYAQNPVADGTSKAEKVISQKTLPPVAMGNPSVLTGTVVDANGAFIVGSQVTLVNDQTNDVQTAQADEEGVYRFDVTSGYTYALMFESPGFATLHQEHVAIKPYGETRQDVTLQVGAVGGAIIVVANYEQPLVKAAGDDDLDLLKELLRNGVDVNQAEEDGTTALELAGGHGNTEMVHLLLQAGANVNQLDRKGDNVLFLLHEDTPAELLALLLASGVNVGQVNEEGNTALISFAEWDSFALVEALIKAGANVNAQNHDGNTALMIAAQEGNTETVKALLAAGANYNLCNANDEDAMELADENDRAGVVELLRAAGAILEGETSPNER